MAQFPVWVNYDRSGSVAIIHRSECGHCKDGMGVKPDGRETLIHWIPFKDGAQAAAYTVDVLGIPARYCWQHACYPKQSL